MSGNIITRIYPLVPVRVASVFADKTSKDTLNDFDDSEQLLDKQREVGSLNWFRKDCDNLAMESDWEYVKIMMEYDMGVVIWERPSGKL